MMVQEIYLLFPFILILIFLGIVGWYIFLKFFKKRKDSYDPDEIVVKNQDELP